MTGTPADTGRCRQAIGLLDLTSLNDTDDAAKIARLCARAATPQGPVAAVCVWPRFVAQCRAALGAKSAGDGAIRIAAVANFPHGAADIAGAVADARAIVAAGGDEVDVVFPYNAWLNGERELGRDLVAACKAACGGGVRLKVIIESGCLRRSEIIAAVSEAAIEAGADFIKTSTGKTSISATLEAARTMLGVIKAKGGSCGFKAAGGIRDAATAALYLDLAARILGEAWISPRHFRFGASGLLDSLLAELGGTEARPGTGY
jgi:deoxyribose-phosphate aldolase